MNLKICSKAVDPYPVTPMHALHCSGKGKNACKTKKQSAELSIKKAQRRKQQCHPGRGKIHQIIPFWRRKNVKLSSRSPLFRPSVDRQHSTCPIGAVDFHNLGQLQFGHYKTLIFFILIFRIWLKGYEIWKTGGNFFIKKILKNIKNAYNKLAFEIPMQVTHMALILLFIIHLFRATVPLMPFKNKVPHEKA